MDSKTKITRFAQIGDVGRVGGELANSGGVVRSDSAFCAIPPPSLSAYLPLTSANTCM
jgi:hypothetical protein